MNSFNIRVYALCIKDKKLLVLNEEYVGQKLTKLPGGGLEYGEGLLDCLKRELQEELSLNIHFAEHFYTQEDFVQSKFRENEQLLTIYYKVEIENWEQLHINIPQIESIDWISLQNENPFTLPVDRLIFEKLQKEYNPSH